MPLETESGSKGWLCNCSFYLTGEFWTSLKCLQIQQAPKQQTDPMPPAAPRLGGQCHIPSSSALHPAQCRASAPVLGCLQENKSHLQVKDLSHGFGCKSTPLIAEGDAWVIPGCTWVPSREDGSRGWQLQGWGHSHGLLVKQNCLPLHGEWQMLSGTCFSAPISLFNQLVVTPL